jgi:transcriptional regulator with XRE-family HTH domain
MTNTYSELNTTVAELVRRQREAAKLRQSDMATLMGYSLQQYGKMERGIAMWNAMHLYQAALILKVQVVDLLPFDPDVMVTGREL